MATGKPINENEIVKDGALESIVSDFDKIYNSMKKADEVLRDFGKSMKEVKFPNSSKDFQSTLDSMDKLEKAYKTQYQTQVDMDKVKKAQQSAEQALQRQREKGIKAMEREKIAQENLNRPYNVANRELLEMKKRYKDLAYQKSQGIKLTKDEAKEYRDLGRSIKDADGNLKRIDSTVGDNFRRVGNYKNAISGLKGALGQLGLAFGGLAIVKGAGQAIIEYENALASFRTIVSDLNDNQFEKFKSQITDIATTTKKSTIEVAKSFEVIAGLNSAFAETAEGLGKVSEASITLSKASGDDLETSATNLVGIMNQFDLAAKDADSAINILAAGQAVGAASITQLGESYKNVGKVASDANIDLAGSTALLEVLGNYSIVGAEAGTKLRGVILKLQQANLGYASGQFDINDALAEYNEKSDKLVSAKEKDAFASKILGAENISAGKILTSNIPLIEKYTQAVTGTSEAQKAAEINSNTLSNRWEELKATLTNLVTTNQSVGSGMDFLKDTLKFLAENINLVITVLTKFVALWVTYKAVMKTMEIAKHIKDLGGLSSIIKDNATNLKSASKESEGFGKSMKAAGTAIVIAIFVEVALALYDIASGAHEAKVELDAMNKALSEADEFVGGVKGQISKKFDAEKLKNETLLANDKINQAVFDQNMKNAEKDRERRLKYEIETETEIRDRAIASVKANQKRYDEVLEKNPLFRNTGEKKLVNRYVIDKAQVEESNTVLKGLIGFQKDLATEELKSLNTTKASNKEQKKAKKEITKTIIDYTKAIRDLNAEMLEGSDDASTQYLRESVKLENSYQDAIDKINSDEATTVIKKNEYLLILQTKYYKDLEEMGAEYEQGQIDKARQDIADRIELEKSAFDLKTGRVDAESRIQELTIYNAKRAEIINSQVLTDEEKNKKLEELEEIHEDRMLEIQLNGLKKRLENEIIIQQEIANGLGVTSKEYEDAQGRILELQEQILNLGAGKFKEKKEDNTLKDKLKKVADYFSNLMDAVQSKIDQTFDKLIESQNKSIENSKNVVANLQASANAGNLQATKSILAEEKAQEEAQKRIEKLQKRQQLTQMITGALGSYSAKVANGDKNALLSTITEVSVLSAFLKSLPSFAVGTDYLDVNGNGVDGDGGIPVIAHKGERIVPAEENKAFGFGTKNKELVKAWSFYKQGVLKPITGVNAVVVPNDNTEILRGIEKGFSKINNWNMSVEQLFSTITVMVEKTKNGDTFTTKKTFKS